MKSRLNFAIQYADGTLVDLDEEGLWVSSFHIPSPDVEVTTINVPGKNGLYKTTKRLKERVIKITVVVEADTIKELEDKKLRIYDLFYQEESYTLVRDVDPTKVVMVDQSGSYDIDNLTDTDGQIALELTMYDPYIYSTEKTQVINDPNSDDVDPVVINEGTAETYPIFTVEVLQPISLLQIVKDIAYMQVGQPVDVDQVEVPEYESILSDNLTSLVGWQAIAGGTTLIDGIVGGAMEVKSNANGDRFAFGPSSYGTNPNGWVGPAVKQELSEALQDFRVVINMSVLNKMIGVGKVMLLLMDDLDNIFGYLSMEDTTASVDLNHARIALLDSAQNKQFLIDTTGDKYNVYNDFEGILRLERRGTKFYAYSAQVDQVTGEHRARDTAPVFTDSGNVYQRKLSQVGIYIAKAKDYKTFVQTANDLSVAKVNDISANQIPYIAQPGDIITFDHLTDKLLLNGDPILMRRKDIDATFFPFTKGKNSLLVNPADAVRVTANWRDAYK